MKLLALFTLIMFSTASIAATNVKVGDIVEKDGVLLTNEEAANIIAESKAQKERCKAVIEFEKEKTRLELQLKINNLQSDFLAEKEKNKVVLELKERETERLYKELDKASNDYLPYAIMGSTFAGVIVSALVSTAIFFAAVQTVKADSVVK